MKFEGLPVRKISEYNPRFACGGYFSDADKMLMTNFTPKMQLKSKLSKAGLQTKLSPIYTPIYDAPIVISNQ